MAIDRDVYRTGRAVEVKTDEGGAFDGTIQEVMSHGFYVRPTDEAVRRAFGGDYFVAADGTYGNVYFKES